LRFAANIGEEPLHLLGMSDCAGAGGGRGVCLRVLPKCLPGLDGE
jgi:hypothetical protein